MNKYTLQFRNIVLICIILIASACKGKKKPIFTHYRDKADSSANYYLVVPIVNQSPCKGILVLIPGFNETPEMVLEQTNLPNSASEIGILTIIPILKTGKLSFSIDSLSQSSLKEIIEEIYTKYALNEAPLLIGGYSIGGSGAIKYAELANQLNYSVKPKAVFAIDPPLDFERVYNSYEKIFHDSKRNKINAEALYMYERIAIEMKGIPQNNITNYYKISPYSYKDSAQTAIIHLIKTPIHIYIEPDVNWWMKERGNDYYNMNSIDAAAMINELNHLGNKNASLIVTENKGYRKPNHQRHPHSWSIADVKELLFWLKQQ